jgi:hypothetical protein
MDAKGLGSHLVSPVLGQQQDYPWDFAVHFPGLYHSVR